MADTTIAANLNQSFNIKSHIPAKIAFNNVVLVDIVTQFGDIVLGKVFDSGIRIYTG